MDKPWYSGWQDYLPRIEKALSGSTQEIMDSLMSLYGEATDKRKFVWALISVISVFFARNRALKAVLRKTETPGG